MNTASVEIFAALLALIALVGTVAYMVLVRVGPSADSDSASGIRKMVSGLVHDVHRSSLWLAWVVAAGATAGSLYFSEVANYAPCQLCWYQRICVYPLAGVLFVSALRRERSARWYCLPMLIAGIGVSAYHYFIEWKPAFGASTCSVGPSCTDIWFRRFGFVTLAFMALSGFIAILILLFVDPHRPRTTHRTKEGTN